MEADRKARIVLTKKEWGVISDFLCCFFNYDGDGHGIIDLTSDEIGIIMHWLYHDDEYTSDNLDIIIRKD